MGRRDDESPAPRASRAFSRKLAQLRLLDEQSLVYTRVARRAVLVLFLVTCWVWSVLQVAGGEPPLLIR